MAEQGQVIDCHTVESWNEQLQNGNESKKLGLRKLKSAFICFKHSSFFDPSHPKGLIVVDFTASWCGPCRFIAPIVADIAKRTPSVTFLKVDVDELNTVAKEWSIEAMPTFLFLKEGKLVDKVLGAMKEELQLRVAKHATAAA